MTAILAFVLPRWKLFAGGMVLGLVAVVFMAQRASIRHWKKQDALHLAQRDLEVTKNAINLASIATLQNVVAAKNAESEARAKALADAKAESARTDARFDALQKADRSRIETLQRLARDLPDQPGCRVPAALLANLEGL